MTTAAPGVRQDNDALFVTGDVTAETVLALRKQGERLIRKANGDLIVDLEELATAHTVILSLLLCWQRLAHQSGIALSFRGVSGRLASLAALSNLDDQLTGFGPESAHPSH